MLTQAPQLVYIVWVVVSAQVIRPRILLGWSCSCAGIRCFSQAPLHPRGGHPATPLSSVRLAASAWGRQGRR